LQIEDLKSYFDDPEAAEDGPSEEAPEMESPEMVMLSKGVPRSKRDLLALLPQRHVVDRLIMRYFTSNSPSQRRLSRLISAVGGG